MKAEGREAEACTGLMETGCILHVAYVMTFSASAKQDKEQAKSTGS